MADEKQTKILSLIPDSLREELINEVADILHDRKILEQKQRAKPATEAELEEVSKNLKI